MPGLGPSCCCSPTSPDECWACSLSYPRGIRLTAISANRTDVYGDGSGDYTILTPGNSLLDPDGDPYSFSFGTGLGGDNCQAQVAKYPYTKGSILGSANLVVTEVILNDSDIDFLEFWSPTCPEVSLNPDYPGIYRLHAFRSAVDVYAESPRRLKLFATTAEYHYDRPLRLNCLDTVPYVVAYGKTRVEEYRVDLPSCVTSGEFEMAFIGVTKFTATNPTPVGTPPSGWDTDDPHYEAIVSIDGF